MGVADGRRGWAGVMGVANGRRGWAGAREVVHGRRGWGAKGVLHGQRRIEESPTRVLESSMTTLMHGQTRKRVARDCARTMANATRVARDCVRTTANATRRGGDKVGEKDQSC